MGRFRIALGRFCLIISLIVGGRWVSASEPFATPAQETCFRKVCDLLRRDMSLTSAEVVSLESMARDEIMKYPEKRLKPQYVVNTVRRKLEKPSRPSYPYPTGFDIEDKHSGAPPTEVEERLLEAMGVAGIEELAKIFAWHAHSWARWEENGHVDLDTRRTILNRYVDYSPKGVERALYWFEQLKEGKITEKGLKGQYYRALGSVKKALKDDSNRDRTTGFASFLPVIDESPHAGPTPKGPNTGSPVGPNPKGPFWLPLVMASFLLLSVMGGIAYAICQERALGLSGKQCLAQVNAERRAETKAERKAKAEARAEARAKQIAAAAAERRDLAERWAKVEAEERARAEAERKVRAEAWAKARADEAKARAEAKAREQREEEEAELRARAKAKAQAEKMRQARAEAEARAAAERESRFGNLAYYYQHYPTYAPWNQGRHASV